MSRTPVRHAGVGPRRRRLLVCTAVFALLVTACGGGTSGGGAGDSASSEADSGASGGTLNIGQLAPPNSMDPAQINQAFEWYINLTYDPLIFKAADGTLEPRLAESFGFVGEGNTSFELKLRDGVRFSDGSPLTADVVRRNIEYFRQAGGQAVPFLASIATVEVVDELTVRLQLNEPDPTIAHVFTQDYLAGNMISGEILDSDPGLLAQESFGAGPYVLDADRTVPNDHYVYTPNPEYWNPDDIRWDEVTIKVMPNPNTALSALETGQVDIIQGDFTTVERAEGAGLKIESTPLVFAGLAFADRSGELMEPLGDVRVRQAINFAVDREEITAAILGEYGIASEQVVPPGWEGFNEEEFYSFDPERARDLLDQAGYGDGFELPVVTTPFASQELVVQAMADQLDEVGIDLALTSETDTARYVEQLSSGRFPAYGIGYGAQPLHLMGPGLFLPDAAVFNPRGSSDPELQRLYDEAAAASDPRRAEVERELVRWLVENAWFAPVLTFPVLFFHNDTVAGVESSPGQPISSPTSWYAAGR
jgi:peptide/nickel transport system substrate-binding protein